MADERRLLLKIDGDSAGARAALGQVKKGSDQLGKNLVKGGKVAATAGVALGGALVFAAMQAGKADREHVKLENTLKNMPKLKNANIKAFDDQARAIARMTAADDDAVTAGQAMLGTFNLTQKQILGITPLVTDYAQKFGVPMEKAAIQVGKALDGQIGSLRKNGVSIDAALYKTDKYRAVQEALASQVGGFAKDEMRTLPAQWERLKNVMGNFMESAGKPIADVLSSVADKISGITQKASDWINANPKIAGTLAKVAAVLAVVLTVGGGLAIIMGKLILAGQAIATVMPAISAASGPIGWALLAIAAAGLLVWKNWDKIKAAGAALWEALVPLRAFFLRFALEVKTQLIKQMERLQPMFAALSATWTNVIQTLKPYVLGFIRSLQENFAWIVKWTKQNWPLISKTIGVVMRAVGTVIKTVIRLVIKTWNLLKPVIVPVVRTIFGVAGTVIRTAMRVIFGVIKAAMQLITGNWKGAWTTIKNVGRTLATGAKDVVVRIIRGLRDTLKGILGGMIDSWRTLGRRIFDALPDGMKARIGKAIEKIKGFISRIINAVKKVLGIGGRGDGPGYIGDGLGEVTGKLVADKLKMFGAMGPLSGGGSTKGLTANARAAASRAGGFGLRVSSGFRPGAITASGNRSLHGSGRAVDLVGNSAQKWAAFNYFAANAGDWGLYEAINQHTIWKPGRGRYRWGPSDHMDHLHLGFRFAKGGIVNAPVLGMVGEEARARPEVVSPLGDLLGMMKQAIGEMGSNSGGPLVTIGQINGSKEDTQWLEAAVERAVFKHFAGRRLPGMGVGYAGG